MLKSCFFYGHSIKPYKTITFFSYSLIDLLKKHILIKIEEINEDQMKRNLLTFFSAIVSTVALCIHIEERTILEINPSNLFSFHYFIVGLLLFFFYRKIKISSHKALHIVSILFSFFMIIGYSYETVGTTALLWKDGWLIIMAILQFLGYYFLFAKVTHLFYQSLLKTSWKPFKGIVKNFWKHLTKHPFILSLSILLLCWLPYMIAFYPAILSPDPSNQIKMFFGMKTSYLNSVNLIDTSVVITNHHPFLHTLLLGGLAKAGYLLGSINIGLFLYSLLQVLALASTCSYTIQYMIRLKTNPWMVLLSLFIYAFIPMFPFYGMSAVKDVYFGMLILLYSLKIYDVIRFQAMKRKDAVFLLLLMILISLVRNNGVYTIILSYPFLFFILKKYRKIILGIFLLFWSVYLGYHNILLPILKITPGSIREVFSIPFQQTARYVTFYQDEVTQKEEKAIQKILDYSHLASQYNPKKSDPVKNHYHKNATKEDLKNYFQVWASMFLKHPMVYIDATMSNIYGYFYPNATNWYLYYHYDKRLQDSGLSYHYNQLQNARNILTLYGLIFPFIPIIGAFSNIALNVWMYLFMISVLFMLKKYRYLIVMMIPFSLILVCVAGPVNTYFRYALPYVFSLPTFFALFLKMIKGKNCS